VWLGSVKILDARAWRIDKMIIAETAKRGCGLVEVKGPFIGFDGGPVLHYSVMRPGGSSQSAVAINMTSALSAGFKLETEHVRCPPAAISLEPLLRAASLVQDGLQVTRMAFAQVVLPETAANTLKNPVRAPEAKAEQVRKDRGRKRKRKGRDH
jgi:hypothetical protein